MLILVSNRSIGTRPLVMDGPGYQSSFGFFEDDAIEFRAAVLRHAKEQLPSLDLKAGFYDSYNRRMDVNAKIAAKISGDVIAQLEKQFALVIS